MPTLELVPKSAPAPPAGTIPDADARERALDITQSFIVEAPAGSGKTGLLIQRFLKLLASDSVTDPGEVLAITFTRKATAEMLERVLSQLRAALADTPVASPFERTTRTLAQAVLARDRLLGWNLLDQPGRLRIRTIDSISAEIATALPLLSGAGGGQRPTDDPAPLYLEAARRTLMALGGGDARLNAALELLLLHRDGHLGNCESLIAAMLGTRDQWGELVPLSRTELDDAYLEGIILPRLDRALDLAICQALTRVSRSVPPGILERLCELASDMGHLEGYKGNPSPIALCAGKSMPPEEKSAHLEHWSALIDLLLTKDGVFRAVRGIRSDYLKFLIESHHKQELVDIIEALRHDDGLRERLCAIRSLPPAEYPREQWQVTKALFHVLSRALTELQLVFAERGECDFTEVALLARTALASDAATEDLALANFKLQHLLVDEMQDTSSGQYRFIELLTRGWDARTQTLFLVGDPKQSIYLFRQARVEGFLATLANAQLGTGQNARPLEVLRLTANFRSRPGLVRAFNEDFGPIFQQVAADGIAYLPATAVRSGTGERNWHTAAIPYLADSLQRAAVIRTQTTEHAQEIRRLLLHWRALPLPPGRTDRWKIAILVRNRRHLLPIVAALRQDEPIPFRAVEIDPLAERPEILDLLALTRALLHPADRTAWLALLRGPWCGLSFADLLRISGHDDPAHAERTLFELMDLRGAELSDDGIARLQPFWQIMSHALRLRGQLPLPQLVGRTWRAFDTPNYLTSEARANTDRFFELLETLETPVSLPRLQQRIGKLYAAPSSAADAVDLMTLHNAKGLEWDFVIVPELQRKARTNTASLLTWLEIGAGDLPSDEQPAGILAPIAGKGRASAQLNSWMRSVHATREAAERKRLFYVACTRAREELHLFAAPGRKTNGEIARSPDSLLQAAWPAAEQAFANAQAPVVVMPGPRPVVALAAAAAPRIIERYPIPSAPDLANAGRDAAHLPARPLFPRPEGSFAARGFGNAMHALLDLLARRAQAGASAEALLGEVSGWTPRASALLRANGLGPADVPRFAANLLRGLRNTVNDPEGLWLLQPHPGAASEEAFADVDGTLRLDRSFLAGSEPLSVGDEFQWIIDFKTASHGASDLNAFLASEQEKYRPQLETYASKLASARPVRLALYYPMLPKLIWWTVEK